MLKTDIPLAARSMKGILDIILHSGLMFHKALSDFFLPAGLPKTCRVTLWKKIKIVKGDPWWLRENKLLGIYCIVSKHKFIHTESTTFQENL